MWITLPSQAAESEIGLGLTCHGEEPWGVGRSWTPGSFAIARPEGRASFDAPWLAMTPRRDAPDRSAAYCPRLPRTANRTASSAARNKARALSPHSFCSATGEES
jgi:hypothetical protein